MKPSPSYMQSLVVSACQSFRSVAPFFFLAKIPILLFFFGGGGGGGFVHLKIFFFLNLKIQKGMWPYRHAHDVLLVTLILNMCL